MADVIALSPGEPGINEPVPRLVEPAHDCGCRLGSMVASLALTAYLVVTLALPLIRGAPVTFSWWQAVAVLLGGALVGKMLGMFRAKRRFDEAMRDFEGRRTLTALRPGAISPERIAP